jgi:predicted RNA-binding protein YlqC (UPF0109 family)
MLEEALDHLVRGIVEHPDDVVVRMQNNRRGEMLEVRVHPDDLGRVIGRSGRTAKALRTVVGALANGRSIRIDIVDTDRRRCRLASRRETVARSPNDHRAGRRTAHCPSSGAVVPAYGSHIVTS